MKTYHRNNYEQPGGRRPLLADFSKSKIVRVPIVSRDPTKTADSAISAAHDRTLSVRFSGLTTTAMAETNLNEADAWRHWGINE